MEMFFVGLVAGYFLGAAFGLFLVRRVVLSKKFADDLIREVEAAGWRHPDHPAGTPPSPGA
jgi:hypothetical protein